MQSGNRESKFWLEHDLESIKTVMSQQWNLVNHLQNSPQSDPFRIQSCLHHAQNLPSLQVFLLWRSPSRSLTHLLQLSESQTSWVMDSPACFEAWPWCNRGKYLVSKCECWWSHYLDTSACFQLYLAPKENKPISAKGNNTGRTFAHSQVQSIHFKTHKTITIAKSALYIQN